MNDNQKAIIASVAILAIAYILNLLIMEGHRRDSFKIAHELIDHAETVSVERTGDTWTIKVTEVRP